MVRIARMTSAKAARVSGLAMRPPMGGAQDAGGDGSVEERLVLRLNLEANEIEILAVGTDELGKGAILRGLIMGRLAEEHQAVFLQKNAELPHEGVPGVDPGAGGD